MTDNFIKLDKLRLLLRQTTRIVDDMGIEELMGDPKEYNILKKELKRNIKEITMYGRTI